MNRLVLSLVLTAAMAFCVGCKQAEAPPAAAGKKSDVSGAVGEGDDTSQAAGEDAAEPDDALDDGGADDGTAESDSSSGEQDAPAPEDGAGVVGDDSESTQADGAGHPDGGGASPDTSGGDSGTSADSGSSRVAPKSSFQKCLCWKKGDDCDFAMMPKVPKDPKFACPPGEACDGDRWVLLQYPKLKHGTCRRLCAIDGAKVVGPGGCAEGEKCAVEKIKVGDGVVKTTAGLCEKDGNSASGSGPSTPPKDDKGP